MISVADSSEGTNTIVGDFFALFGAFMYGLYTTTLRKLVPEESSHAVNINSSREVGPNYYVPMPLLFGIVGLCNALLLSPLLPIWSWASWERFSWPSPQVGLFLSLNALIGTALSDVLWAQSVIMTNPVIATVGLFFVLAL